jgi:hypothetical protein
MNSNRYLSPADGPVVEGLEAHEVVYAANQAQYNPLRTLRSNTEGCRVLSRWSPTPEQREALAEGADIFLELLTFGFPLQPILMSVGEMGTEFVAREFGLPMTGAKAQLSLAKPSKC